MYRNFLLVLEGEDWRPVDGYDGLYEISNLGRIKSLRSRTPKILVQDIGPRGYLQIKIRKPGSRRGSQPVHRLVLSAFAGPRPSGMGARHINGKKVDNRIGNLCWGTPVENHSDKVKHGTAQVGDKHHSAKLTAPAVAEIRQLAGAGMSQREIAKMFGVSQPAVGYVVRRDTWGNVS
jgi:hypothetical protein